MIFTKIIRGFIRTQRAEELKARMDKHQQNQEGMLAYSMINLMSEKA